MIPDQTVLDLVDELFHKYASDHRGDAKEDANDFVENFSAKCDDSERIEQKLHKIKSWCNAYPVSIFPEPDLEKMAQVLKDNGMTIDSIGASSMRHVLKGILEIIEGDK